MTDGNRLGLSMDLAPTSRCPWLSHTLTAAAPAYVSTGATTARTEGLHGAHRSSPAPGLCPLSTQPRPEHGLQSPSPQRPTHPMAIALGGAVSGPVNVEVLAQSFPTHLEGGGRGGQGGCLIRQSVSTPDPTLPQQRKPTQNLQASFKGQAAVTTARPACLQPFCWQADHRGTEDCIPPAPAPARPRPLGALADGKVFKPR